MLDAIFLKGYQWPFDPRKAAHFGSSLIDILVHQETVIRGRRVFLDFMHNPAWGSLNGALDFTLLGSESHPYLSNSNALFGTPIARLEHMNRPAVDLYLDHGIDLSKEYLEIAVCAQHNNGGLTGDAWWESNVAHFFPVGEVCGTHGVYRPGGSALNSGQVGSARAAQYIAARYRESPLPAENFIQQVQEQVQMLMDLGSGYLSQSGSSNVRAIREGLGRRMTEAGAHIRSRDAAVKALEEARAQLSTLHRDTLLASSAELAPAFQNRDLLITQIVYLSAILDYMEQGGKSRGSYLIQDPAGVLPAAGLPEDFRFSLPEAGHMTDILQETAYENGICTFRWRPVKPIPAEDDWFENVWNAYRRDEIIQK
jgi:succinate dehydrogenase/fumarate reductase flavoprotein subunit